MKTLAQRLDEYEQALIDGKEPWPADGYVVETVVGTRVYSRSDLKVKRLERARAALVERYVEKTGQIEEACDQLLSAALDWDEDRGDDLDDDLNATDLQHLASDIVFLQRDIARARKESDEDLDEDAEDRAEMARWKAANGGKENAA